MREELLQPGRADPVGGGRGDDAAAAPARRVRRPAPAQGAPRDHARAPPAPGPGGRSPAARRAARSRQDVARRDRRDRDGRACSTTSGPALERAGDLAAILTNLDDGDVLFIDEIHRLPRAVEEVLYPAMEDFQLDIVIGKGPSARSIRLDLPRFTLVGATTRTGLITGPLARPLRLRRPARLLRARGPRDDPRPGRAHPRRPARAARARARSRRGRAARRGSRTGC